MAPSRFSGQPASGGDFVFIRAASRPILTNCENVGTVVPLFWCDHTTVASTTVASCAHHSLSRVHPLRMPEGFAAPANRTPKFARERSPVLKGLRRIRRYHQQETPYAVQEVEQISWLQFGAAYSALRGWRPIPAALLSHSVLLCSGTEDISLPTNDSKQAGAVPLRAESSLTSYEV